MHFYPDFVDKCGQIVDNFLHLCGGYPCKREKRGVFVWITASYPHKSTKLSTTVQSKGAKTVHFVSVFHTILRKTRDPHGEEKDGNAVFWRKMWITPVFSPQTGIK